MNWKRKSQVEVIEISDSPSKKKQKIIEIQDDVEDKDDEVTIVKELLTNGAFFQNHGNDIIEVIEPETRPTSKSLHWASKTGDVNLVEELLKSGAQINAKNKDQSTSLHLAAENGHLEIVTKLLENGANSNVKDKTQSTPLHVAVKKANLEVTKELLKHKATEVNVQDLEQKTPLHLACIGNNLHLVELLLDHGSHVQVKDIEGETPLDHAFYYYRAGDFETKLESARTSENSEHIIQLMVKRLENVNVEVCGESLLKLASKENDLDLVKFLLRRGANPSVTFNEEMSCLYTAASKGNSKIVSELLKFGANFEALDKKSNCTPLIGAISKDDFVETVKLLLKKGANPNVQYKNGKMLPPIVLASELGRHEIVKELLKHHADINAHDESKDTALHKAVRNNHQQVIKILLQHRAQVNFENHKKETSLHLAAANPDLGQDIIEEELFENVDDPNKQDYLGFTPFHIAILKDNQKVIKKLLEHEALDINVKSENGNTALHLAITNKNQEMCKLLIEKGADLTIINSLGKTVQDCAIRLGLFNIATMIVKKLANEIEISDAPKEITIKNECSICYSPKNGIFALQPCGHATTCELCCMRLINFEFEFQTTGVCPICRKNITNYQKIFT